jgi:hypothetical protein
MSTYDPKRTSRGLSGQGDAAAWARREGHHGKKLLERLIGKANHALGSHGGPVGGPMALTLDFQERQHLAEADRHLDTANHCLVRQFRALSTLGSNGGNLSLAEAVLKTMLRTHELMAQQKERIERKLGLNGDIRTERNTDCFEAPTSRLRLGARRRSHVAA